MFLFFPFCILPLQRLSPFAYKSFVSIFSLTFSFFCPFLPFPPPPLGFLASCCSSPLPGGLGDRTVAFLAVTPAALPSATSQTHGRRLQPGTAGRLPHFLSVASQDGRLRLHPPGVPQVSALKSPSSQPGRTGVALEGGRWLLCAKATTLMTFRGPGNGHVCFCV